jgi:hypothetical protein
LLLNAKDPRELLQEQRRAVIDGAGGKGRLEPFSRLGLATLDQLLAIRG